MQELSVKVGNCFILVGNDKAVAAGKGADDARLDFFDLTNLKQFWQVSGRNCQYHAFLGLREPDLPGSQPTVFEGSLFQLNVGACLRAHFADGR